MDDDVQSLDQIGREAEVLGIELARDGSDFGVPISSSPNRASQLSPQSLSSLIIIRSARQQ